MGGCRVGALPRPRPREGLRLPWRAALRYGPRAGQSGRQQDTPAQGCVKNPLGPGRLRVIRSARDTNCDRHNCYFQLYYFM